MSILKRYFRRFIETLNLYYTIFSFKGGDPTPLGDRINIYNTIKIEIVFEVISIDCRYQKQVRLIYKNALKELKQIKK
jgi:hypothetical protein